MNLRTDLALERRELITGKSKGIASKYYEKNSVKITRISVLNEVGEKAIGKPVGEYITLEVKPFSICAELFDGRLEVLAEELNSLLPKEGTILVAGLGNEDITPDALGPRAMSLLLATRHITPELARSIGFGELRSVAAIVPGVLGKTGIETAEIISGIVKKIKPSAVIVIDALASRRTERLGTTVQLADTGVSPGSGVGNSRSKIDKSTLGIPVIAIGVPTVVDVTTLACDLLEQSGQSCDELLEFPQPPMMVTPREIDLVIERAAQLIAMGINCALQPHLDPKDILAVVG